MRDYWHVVLRSARRVRQWIARTTTATDPTSVAKPGDNSNSSWTALGVVAVLFLAFLSTGLSGGRRNASPAENERRVQATIDPNTAEWFELAQLPGIGEMKAKQIVSFRERRESNVTGLVFTRLSDLGAVKGIGPKTVHRIGRFLRIHKLGDKGNAG